MANAERGITKADIFLALGRRTVTGGDEIPLGGRITTPAEEVEMGQQLQCEWDEYKRPILEARGRVFEAMSGRSISLPED